MRNYIQSVVVVTAVLVASAAGAADNGLIDLKDVPESVRKAADAAAPGTVWLPLAKESDGYMLIGSDAKKRTVEVLSDKTGKKCGVRVSAVLTDVPEAVMRALKKEIPNFEPKRVQMVGPSADNLGGYRFQGAGYEGLIAGVYVTEKGVVVDKTPTPQSR